MPPFNFIAVEGGISSGKTGLAQFLAEKFSASLVTDETGSNPFLTDFYASPSRYALSAQVFFLVSRYQQLRRLSEPDLFERRHVSDYSFARDELFARLNLGTREYSLYQSLSRLMLSDLPSPDLVIYLQASVPVLLSRIKERKSHHFAHITSEYLESLTQAFDHYFFHYDKSPLLIVNTNHLDLFNKKSDLELVAQEIEKASFGTRYFAPAQRDVLL